MFFSPRDQLDLFMLIFVMQELFSLRGQILDPAINLWCAIQPLCQANSKLPLTPLIRGGGARRRSAEGSRNIPPPRGTNLLFHL
jgi:hypothetical protein